MSGMPIFPSKERLLPSSVSIEQIPVCDFHLSVYKTKSNGQEPVFDDSVLANIKHPSDAKWKSKSAAVAAKIICYVVDFLAVQLAPTVPTPLSDPSTSMYAGWRDTSIRVKSRSLLRGRPGKLPSKDSPGAPGTTKHESLLSQMSLENSTTMKRTTLQQMRRQAPLSTAPSKPSTSIFMSSTSRSTKLSSVICFDEVSPVDSRSGRPGRSDLSAALKVWCVKFSVTTRRKSRSDTG